MPEPTEWYRSLETEVETLKSRLGRDEQDYHLDRFLRAARRVDEFAAECPKCRIFKPLMVNMVRDLLSNAPQILRDQKRLFLGNMQDIITHLHRTHHLVSEGQNIGTWLGMGAGVGVLLGSLLSSSLFNISYGPAIGLPIGVGTGLAIGTALDDKARREGRFI